MGIKSIRFNNTEEAIIQKISNYYHLDYTGLIRKMINEKYEEIADINFIETNKEIGRSDYKVIGDIGEYLKE